MRQATHSTAGIKGYRVDHGLELARFLAGWWCVKQHGPPIEMQLCSVDARSQLLLCECQVSRWLRCLALRHLLGMLLVPIEE
jgi:hypothetical protein